MTRNDYLREQFYKGFIEDIIIYYKGISYLDNTQYSDIFVCTTIDEKGDIKYFVDFEVLGKNYQHIRFEEKCDIVLKKLGIVKDDEIL